MDLLVGDIILSHSHNSNFATLITCMTGCYWSHCSIYLGNGLVIESIRTGVRKVPFNEAIEHSDYIILRCLMIDDKFRLKIMELAEKFIGFQYDFQSTIKIFRKMVKSYSFLPKKDDAIICSSLVVDIYKKVGIDLCPLKNLPLPKDILESPYLICVGKS